MKKLLLLVVILVIIVASPTIVWWFGKETPINLIVLDKTVPVDNYREHKSFMWVINNLKYTNSKTNGSFVYNQDYYGFFPLKDKKYEIKTLPSELPNPDMIYITDTYGVYTEDFYGENIRGNRSELIYGGLQIEEVLSVEKALNDKNILIAEFNTLASPTPDKAREKLEELLGIKWTGWIGRYFLDLSSTNVEVPLWMIRNYEKQYGREWTFSGQGFALVNQDDRVIILEVGKEIGPKLNRIMFTPEALAEYKVKNEVEYNYWFDIVEAGHDCQVLAEYRLDTTKDGERFLRANGVPTTFPAVVKRFGKHRTYYFAGDYADNNNIPDNWKTMIWRPALGINSVDPQDNFFWQVYLPLMKQIMTEIKLD